MILMHRMTIVDGTCSFVFATRLENGIFPCLS